MTAEPVRIDVVSDVMCPWCYIGKRRLEHALEAVPEVPVTVFWRPFQLDPTLPVEGKDRKQYLDEKFGPNRAPAVYERIREAGRGEGIEFRFDLIERSPNTIDAHRLIRWAAAEGVQDAVVERLFRMYFLEGADLTQTETLIRAATDAGMERLVVEKLFAGHADRMATEQEIAAAQHMGVTGVPCFILGGKYAVMGAQPPDILASAIRQVAAEREAAGAGERPTAV